ncbi:hypothetical protein C0993_005387 [Termitomyces sp. T159_Od127]|nr:hypothetical protein C0993_005387 [Termitomyces sp. T159_Od127]
MGCRIATMKEVEKELASVASLPADALAILMTEQEFQETLKRGEELEKTGVASKRAAKKPDRADPDGKTHAKQVSTGALECQLTSSRVRVEDLVTDKIKKEEQQQSVISMVETMDSVPLPDMQWAYNPCMPTEWNEVVASIVMQKWVGLF